MMSDSTGVERFRNAVERVAGELPRARLPVGQSSGGATDSRERQRWQAQEQGLRNQERGVGWKQRGIFVAAALFFHVAIFAIVFPEIEYQPPEVTTARRVMVVRKYVPPPPPRSQRQKIARRLTKKLPIPDPTPDQPEPVIEAAREPSPAPIDPEMRIILGVPDPPPATGPLLPGIGGVSEPELIRETRVEPVYPELARRARIEGQVILQVVVAKDGSISDLTVFKEPAANLGFAQAARRAVQQWRYTPAMQNGRPVDVFITVVVTFTLE